MLWWRLLSSLRVLRGLMGMLEGVQFREFEVVLKSHSYVDLKFEVELTFQRYVMM